MSAVAKYRGETLGYFPTVAKAEAAIRRAERQYEAEKAYFSSGHPELTFSEWQRLSKKKRNPPERRAPKRVREALKKYVKKVRGNSTTIRNASSVKVTKNRDGTVGIVVRRNPPKRRCNAGPASMRKTKKREHSSEARVREHWRTAEARRSLRKGFRRQTKFKKWAAKQPDPRWRGGR